MHLCCKECGSRLAYDQRYCLDCGARRGALRPRMAQWIGIETQAAAVAAPEADARAGTADSEQARRQPSMPSPRVLGVAVMALLAFGVLIGSAVSPVQESSANGPLVVAVARTTGAPSTAATAETPTLPPSTAPEETPVPTTSESATPTSTTPAGKPKSAAPSKTKTSEPESGSATTLPPIKHVFLIVLSD